MKCPKCGTMNAEGSKFCIGCGTPVGTVAAQPQPVQQSVQAQPVQPQPAQAQPVQPQPSLDKTVVMNRVNTMPTYSGAASSNNGEGIVEELKEKVMSMVRFMTKPITTLKEEMPKNDNVKEAGLLAGTLALMVTLARLLTTMYNTVKPREIFGTKTDWNFKGLGEVPYLDIIFKTIGIVIGLIAIVSLVVYIMGLLFKKEGNYFRVTAIASYGFVPILLGGLVVMPLLQMINFQVSLIATIILGAYGAMAILTGINLEYKFEDSDMKVYFLAAIYSVLIVFGYFLMMYVINSMMSGIFGSLGFGGMPSTSGLGDLTNFGF